MFNILITGDYNTTYSSSAITFLERIPSGSCNVYFSGTTGSFKNPIINHIDGNFSGSIIPLNWSENYNDLMIKACINDTASFDLILLNEINGNWINYIDSYIITTEYGIPVISAHYNDTKNQIKIGNFYGFPPIVNIGWGNFNLNNSGSYGNELEFYDNPLHARNLYSNIAMIDSSGSKLPLNELNSAATVAAKYLNLIIALSASYAASTEKSSEIYSSYILENKRQFYFDTRQYLRQISSRYTASWSSTEGYGIIQLHNKTGSYDLMPDITSSINFDNLNAGTPFYISVIEKESGSKFEFNWKNFYQSSYKNTEIKVNDRTIYKGENESFTWTSDLLSKSAKITFHTNLKNGLQSIPEENSIINLNVLNSANKYRKLYYGYSCANNKKYIAISTLYTEDILLSSGVVDILTYNQTTNCYENIFSIKKIVNPDDFLMLLGTENLTEDIDDNLIGDDFLSTESSEITAPLLLSSENLYKINTEKNYNIYIKDFTKTDDEIVLNLEVDNIFNLINYTYDKFGKSLALNDDLLAVGCPSFFVNFSNNQSINYGTVDIYNLSTHKSGEPFYPLISIPAVESNDQSFGDSVSFCKGDDDSLYLAVGSGTVYGSAGGVFIFKRNGIDNKSWDLIQTLLPEEQNECFGGKLSFDQSGTKTLVVGNSNTVSNVGKVYIYEFDGNLWVKTRVLYPKTDIEQKLEYINDISPIIATNNCSGYGNSLSIWNDTIIVGAPTDTAYYEYTGGDLKHRGAIYFYKRCAELTNEFRFIQKTWGNNKTLIDNKFGFDVSMYENKAIVTVPKYYTNFTANYIEKTLTKRLACNPYDFYYDTLGEVSIYDYNNSSSLWDLTYTYQKNKEYNVPYLNYGYCGCLYHDVFVIGAPCIINDVENFTNYYNDAIRGYAYIYNLNDLNENVYVGNVFYRDGKIILSNSGSIFSNLLKNPYDSSIYEYDLSYKGKLTLHEKQIVCTIQPGEFNYSTNPTSMINNSYFSFKDLDLMFKYLNSKIYGEGKYDWWNNLNFTEVEESLFNLYTENYDYENVLIDSHVSTLSSSYSNWDVDGNNKINLNDMILIWKYFADTINSVDVFRHTELKSKRKTLTEIIDYIKNYVIVKQYGKINPLFMNFEYSSSIDRTGSYLASYITTVGLYDGIDLVGVAKLASPIKNSGEYILNILVKWDH